MKKRRLAAGALSIALALTMVSTSAFAASVEFTDVPSSHWAHASISEMADKGVVSGTGNNKYSPNATVSYAQFSTMIARSFYNDQIEGGGDKWYSSFIATVEKVGALEGTKVLGNDSLVEAGINRYEMAQVMYNVMSQKGVTIPNNFNTSKIGDWPSIPANYQKAVSACYSLGTLSGTDSKGTFSGTTMMTRAQAAVVMDRLLEVCGGASTPVVPETPGEIPSGAVQITSKKQLIDATGLLECDGGFHMDPNSVMYGGAHIGVSCEGYSTATLTITAVDKDIHILAKVGLIGTSIWDVPEKRGEEVVKAGETLTLTFNCSGGRSFGLDIDRVDAAGNFAEGWITNFYLY